MLELVAGHEITYFNGDPRLTENRKRIPNRAINQMGVFLGTANAKEEGR